VTHYVLIGLGVLIAVLTVVAALDLLPPLRIVPDDTHFDFTRFRRISFPISAALSILAIVLFFTHGLNFGIDFKGGTLLEVQNKAGPADIGAMRLIFLAGEQQLYRTQQPAALLGHQDDALAALLALQCPGPPVDGFLARHRPDEIDRCTAFHRIDQQVDELFAAGLGLSETEGADRVGHAADSVVRMTA
jgi:hypothetical protein